jgi:hypothetical protein
MDDTIFDKNIRAIMKLVGDLREAHRVSLFDKTAAAQEPLTKELAAKEAEALELAELYEKTKPVAEAKIRLLQHDADVAIVKGDEAKAIRLRQEAEAVKKDLAAIKEREQKCYIQELTKFKLRGAAGEIYEAVYPGIRKSLIDIQKLLVELLDGTVTLLESFNQAHNLHGRVDPNDLTPQEYGVEEPVWRSLWMWYSGRK